MKYLLTSILGMLALLISMQFQIFSLERRLDLSEDLSEEQFKTITALSGEQKADYDLLMAISERIQR